MYPMTSPSRFSSYGLPACGLIYRAVCRRCALSADVTPGENASLYAGPTGVESGAGASTCPSASGVMKRSGKNASFASLFLGVDLHRDGRLTH
jgi:hypothetical protein